MLSETSQDIERQILCVFNHLWKLKSVHLEVEIKIEVTTGLED